MFRPKTIQERTLLAHVLGVPLNRLLIAPEPSVTQLAEYRRLLAEHERGVPLQYLTGVAHFRTVSVFVGPGVFVPRPETELLAGWALEVAPKDARVVELCTGSGAIAKALATERPDLEVHAVELSEDAFDFAAKNLAGLGVDLRLGDFAEAFTDLNGTVDLVVTNPPYVPLTAFDGLPVDVREHEPPEALFSGDDGLDAMRAITSVAQRLLRPGGWVGAEHAEVQSEAVVELFARAGYVAVQDHLDLAERPRFVTAQTVAG